MIHPFGTGSFPRGVRDGRGGPVTCALCGCRLQAADEGETAYVHFNPLGGRDARGCRVDCVDLVHDASGRALAGSALG